MRAAWFTLFLLAFGIPALAQSPFEGIWVAQVPTPGGDPVRFVLDLAVEDEKLTGTLQVGDAEPVAIEDGRVVGDGTVISFKRTLDADDGEHIRFLGRVLEDGLHVGFMQMPGTSTPEPRRPSSVVNFTARRLQPPRRGDR